MWGKTVTHWTSSIRHWWWWCWRGVCSQTTQPPAWSQLPLHLVFRDHCWRGMEKLPKFCPFTFHGFVTAKMTTMRTESRPGHPSKQYPWPFSGGCVGLTSWLLVTICSLERLSLRTRMHCCCWPEVQPEEHPKASWLEYINTWLLKNLRLFFQRFGVLTGLFSHFILHWNKGIIIKPVSIFSQYAQSPHGGDGWGCSCQLLCALMQSSNLNEIGIWYLGIMCFVTCGELLQIAAKHWVHKACCLYRAEQVARRQTPLGKINEECVSI